MAVNEPVQHPDTGHFSKAVSPLNLKKKITSLHGYDAGHVYSPDTHLVEPGLEMINNIS